MQMTTLSFFMMFFPLYGYLISIYTKIDIFISSILGLGVGIVIFSILKCFVYLIKSCEEYDKYKGQTYVKRIKGERL